MNKFLPALLISTQTVRQCMAFDTSKIFMTESLPKVERFRTNVNQNVVHTF